MTAKAGTGEILVSATRTCDPYPVTTTLCSPDVKIPLSGVAGIRLSPVGIPLLLPQGFPLFLFFGRGLLAVEPADTPAPPAAPPAFPLPETSDKVRNPPTPVKANPADASDEYLLQLRIAGVHASICLFRLSGATQPQGVDPAERIVPHVDVRVVNRRIIGPRTTKIGTVLLARNTQ